jgi:hypothetical protein
LGVVFYSIDSPIYAAESVENTNACTELAKIPRTITGKGTNNGTNKHRTDTTISSAKIFPNKRKLSESGLVKTSKILIGRNIGVGEMYRAKNPQPFAFNPP